MSAKSPAAAATLRKTRFAQVPQWVAMHPDLLKQPTALAVYVHLAILADYRTRVTTSDWREISERTGWSRVTVMRAMRVLRAAGVILRKGDDVLLPMDPPLGIKSDTELNGSSIKSDTGEYQIRDSAVSDLISRPIYPEVNSEGSIIASDDAKEPKTPIARCAHRLTVKAFERNPKPTSKFTAVLGVMRSTLNAGWSEQDIEQVITDRDRVVFTLAGLRVELEANAARERRSRARQGSRPRSESELLSDQRAGYQEAMQRAAAEGDL